EEEGLLDEEEKVFCVIYMQLLLTHFYIQKKMNEVDQLTGIPRESDVLLFAVPVCGPYQIFQQYKYKVKLDPGKAKKGAGIVISFIIYLFIFLTYISLYKATKSAMEYFLRLPEATERERELLKCVNETEVINQLVGNARV